MFNSEQKEISAKTFSLRMPESIRSFLEVLHRRYHQTNTKLTACDMSHDKFKHYVENPVQIEYSLISANSTSTLKKIIDLFKNNQPISTAQFRFLFDEIVYAYTRHESYFDPKIFESCLECLRITYDFYATSSKDEALYWHRSLGFDENNTFELEVLDLKMRTIVYPQTQTSLYLSIIPRLLEKATLDDFFRLNQKFLPYLPTLFDIAKRGQYYRGLSFEADLSKTFTKFDRPVGHTFSFENFQIYLGTTSEFKHYMSIYLKNNNVQFGTKHETDIQFFDHLFRIDVSFFDGKHPIGQTIKSKFFNVMFLKNERIALDIRYGTIFFSHEEWHALRQHWQEIRETDIYKTIEQSVADRFGRI